MSAQASHDSHYRPPLDDIRFVHRHWLGAEADWRSMPAHDGLDQDTADMVVEAAGRFCAEVLAPLNGPADLQGCRLEQGRVRTPDGFPAAYAAFVEAGWPALACAPEAGGQGLPQLLDAALHEMLASANHGWTMYPGILHGAYACLHAHGDDHLRATDLPHIGRRPGYEREHRPPGAGAPARCARRHARPVAVPGAARHSPGRWQLAAQCHPLRRH
jgi:alkylation response protein AidB-like acyl-CoA dehydrogenase